MDKNNTGKVTESKGDENLSKLVREGLTEKVLKGELPRSVGAQYATGGQWGINSGKNEVYIRSSY